LSCLEPLQPQLFIEDSVSGWIVRKAGLAYTATFFRDAVSVSVGEPLLSEVGEREAKGIAGHFDQAVERAVQFDDEEHRRRD